MGGGLDGRSDLFAVGIVLAEMFMGRRLFTAPADLDVLLMVRDARIERLDKYGRESAARRWIASCARALQQGSGASAIRRRRAVSRRRWPTTFRDGPARGRRRSARVHRRSVRPSEPPAAGACRTRDGAGAGGRRRGRARRRRRRRRCRRRRDARHGRASAVGPSGPRSRGRGARPTRADRARGVLAAESPRRRRRRGAGQRAGAAAVGRRSRPVVERPERPVGRGDSGWTPVAAGTADRRRQRAGPGEARAARLGNAQRHRPVHLGRAPAATGQRRRRRRDLADAPLLPTWRSRARRAAALRGRRAGQGDLPGQGRARVSELEPSGERFGEYLVAHGHLDRADLERALACCRSTPASWATRWSAWA